ncbi:PREDICTED: uncharacterized protein LOC107358902 [Acropora digitifera]|uniref:uncharacterized protein LOC107358902 n=1 Tax=Acropora digitifera TaxID=70779 RepID=UPI000779FB65|nr:PREDICTED: uncharacterized protein LOC107358902 [Acropora digitifera]
MAEANKNFTAIPMDEKNPISVRHDLEEPFNEDFWLKVQEKFNSCTGISWNRAMDEVRTDRLITKHGRDTILVIIRDWPASKKYKEKPELVASLEYLISRFTEILLERDTDEEYKYYRVEKDEEDKEDPAHPTLLHLAAEQNFVHVAKLLVEKYPALVYFETERMENERRYLPVEKALMSYKDETAAYLVSQMKHDWVYELFLYDDELNRAKFSFGHFISHKNLKTGQHDMMKTVNSVLDRLVNPHWPYLPEKTRELGETSDRIDLAWSSVPDDPLNYDFLYHLLEVDEQGREPKIDEHTPNEMFNRNSVSCLRRIAESKDKKAIQHPVVRMLIMRKWNKFGHWWFCLQAAFYTLFLTVLSYALIYGSTQDDPTKYSGKANGLRLFCEVLTVIFLMFFFFEEVNEAERLVTTSHSIAVLPFRIFFFFRTTGLYTKTLAKIIYRDMIRFGVVFFIVFLGFCGALYMTLKATDNQDLFLSYGWLMLAAVRALVEQQPAEEDYSKFNWLAILIILAYMAMVIVILLNVLIAQLSDTYSEAKRNAKLQYSIDRMLIVTRLEDSRFARFNLRVKYYQEGDRVSETTLVKEMLEYNDERRPWETMEEKLSLIRSLMRRVVGKVSDKTE